MSKYDPTYDVFTNRYRYFLFVSIKQLDTHVHFDLYDYVETEEFVEVEKKTCKKRHSATQRNFSLLQVE